MIRKKRAGAGWRRAFLGALARGLSIAQAAREAGIDPSAVHAARRRDPAFGKAWARAREKGVVRLSRSEPKLAPDEVVRGSADGRPRIQRAGPGRWSAGREQLFFEVMATTANVSAACRAVGVSNTAVYARRERWPGFAARWEAALAAGWRGLDALVLEGATVALGGGAVSSALEATPPPSRASRVPPPPRAGEDQWPNAPVLTAEQAITVWKMHRAAVTGEGRRGRHDWRRETTMEEVRAEVLKRIRALNG